MLKKVNDFAFNSNKSSCNNNSNENNISNSNNICLEQFVFVLAGETHAKLFQY